MVWDSWPEKETLRWDKTKIYKVMNDVEKLSKRELCTFTSICSTLVENKWNQKAMAQSLYLAGRNRNIVVYFFSSCCHKKVKYTLGGALSASV